jgi:hypothetical protein
MKWCAWCDSPFEDDDESGGTLCPECESLDIFCEDADDFRPESTHEYQEPIADKPNELTKILNDFIELVRLQGRMANFHERPDSEVPSDEENYHGH